jgi:hypothetical protein
MTSEAFRNAEAPVSSAKEKWNAGSCKTIGQWPDVFVGRQGVTRCAGASTLRFQPVVTTPVPALMTG